MASSSLPHKQDAFSGIEPPSIMRKVEQSSRLFDVFINHRGPDVKLTLATELYNSLKDLNIKAFLDSEEKELGISFRLAIETAIRSASVHIAIFSKKYAESPWCLAELVLMLQSKAKIIPLFYQVEPVELRYIEKGVYAGAFLEYEEKGRYLDKIEEWKEALQKVSYSAGYKFNNSDDCKDIVSAVEKEVQRTKSLHVAKYPVGLHKLVKDFERRCLDEFVQEFDEFVAVPNLYRMKKAAKVKVNVVGIFGMGGVGKTTLSKELFNQKRSQYTRASFLFDVREACACGKLPSLQSKLLKDIFCEDISFLSSEEGTSYLRDRLERSSSFSFLVVLDDIDHLEQLDALLVMDALAKSGDNLIIITTRDVGVLVSAGIDIAYHLKGLHGEDGRELFCWHSFDQPLPVSGYEDLVQDFVNMCGGLPLSLIVLGRHVFGRDQWYWQDELEKLKETLPGDIKRRLKISTDTLDNVEKQIFMDIACFFIEKSITDAMSIWKGSGWKARRGLETLKEKCLIEEEAMCLSEYKWDSSEYGSALRMHDHLRDLGREMADELSHPRRVWRPQFIKSLGFQNILAETKGRCFHSILDKSIGCQITYFLGEPEDGSDASLLWLQLEYLSYLECLTFPEFHMKSSIPSWIPLQKLQCLRISNGRFQKLWQSDMQAPSHLEELQIRDTFLIEFPDLLGKLNDMDKFVLHTKGIQLNMWSLLESLRMNLRSLKMMSSSITGDLAYNVTAEGTIFKSLVIYYDFKRLWEGEMALNNEKWSRTVMSNIEYLEINGYGLVRKILINGNCCQRLQSLKICEMKKLIEADLARIKTLHCLEITGCEKFKRLSATPDLCKLVKLEISECVEFEELTLGHLNCLEKILIENCNHLKTVSGISNLAKLVKLEISGCHMLEFDYLCLSGMKCLESITFGEYVKVKSFELDGCEILKTIMFDCKHIVKLSIRYCAELENLPDLIGPSCLKRIGIDACGNLKYLRLSGLENLESVTGNLEIKQCPPLEELPSPGRVSCLEKIHICFCEKLQRIILPTTLLELKVESCRDLQRIEGMVDLTKLTVLVIEQCPALEELPSVAGMNCLRQIQIASCEKLQNIILPTTIAKLWVESCRDLQRIGGIGDLTKLTNLIIKQCPALEELPSVAGMNCLRQIKIGSCEKLQNIILPTTIAKLWVESCRDLQRIEGIGDLTKLTFLVIKQCPALEELSNLARMICLERILIGSCEKLQNIILPTTIGKLWVESCRNLQRIEGIAELTKLKELVIEQCPAFEQLPSLAGMIYLEQIHIDSCEKLQNIILPTTLLELRIESCRDLQRIEGIADLTKLTLLVIKQCPQLEQLPSLAGMICLEEILISSWEKLQNIILPTTLLELWIESCRNLQRIEGIVDLTKLKVLVIKQCPAFEQLPSLAGMICLEQIQIDSCEKLQDIILPTTLLELRIESCKDLQRIEGIADLTKLTLLVIKQCPQLEQLPSLAGMICLEEILISSWEKLQNIILPTTLLELWIESCRDLQRIEGIADLTKLTLLVIKQCPQLEQLPSLAGMICLEEILISSWEKLQNIILPTTLLELCIESCRDLQRIEGITELTRLKVLVIEQCPAFEQLPSLAGMIYLEQIRIDSCEKLQNIILPTTLLELRIESCKDLQRIEGIADLTKLTRLVIKQCPQLEQLPSLAGMICLEQIQIDSCEKLENILGIEELQSLASTH